MKTYPKYLFILSALFLIGCAKRGTITGGPKDTIAPILEMSTPKNFNTNFKGSEIKLYFNEYVKLKDVAKQLIISPPMATAPEITPTNSSKYITIKIKDTLQPNTTYSFNFGQSIQDNNEGNPYSQFKYIFSTGSYIDSLSIEGRIRDAKEQKADNFVDVMLYEVNDKYTDSVVYKDKPRYITNTLDSLMTFKLENLKAGNYMLVAMKDNSSNFRFDPRKDKIGFYKTPITVPTDEKFELELFREVSAFKAFKPSQAGGGRMVMGYEGDPKDIKAVIKNGTDIIPAIVTRLPEKDSVQIWFKPIKADSVSVSISKGSFLKDFTVKLKKQKTDSLNITALHNGTIHFRDTFALKSTVPLVLFDNSKISFRKKDSTAVDFTTSYDEFEQQLRFNFKKEPLESYTVQLMPGAMTDLYDRVNDTLAFKLNTKNTTDYGYMRVNLKNVRSFPVIVELTDNKGKVLATEYATSAGGGTVEFLNIEPNTFTLRAIYDENQNGKWDTGSFLEKRQAEDVIYFPTPIDVRSNWDFNQDFDLGGG